MTIPSKSQDKTEEQESASPSHAEDDSLDDTIPPPPPITLPNFTNFRNIYINPITLPSTIPPNKDENGESSPPQPKWDEFCIQWCKQKDLNRDKTIVPECHMLCFRRINAHLKNDLLKKQVVVKEELNHKEHQIENVAQVLYNKTENGGDKTELKVPRNFMDGYYLYYIKGLELCQKHTEGMKNDEMYRLGWTQNNPEESEIDLGEKFEQTKSETKRIIKRAFTPGYQLAKRYVESWKDGTQTSFFKRFYESVQRMDAVHIVQDNIKKAVEVWINDDDDDGGIGRKPNENNGNNRGDGDGNNYNGNGKNSSDERNERDD